MKKSYVVNQHFSLQLGSRITELLLRCSRELIFWHKVSGHVELQCIV